jgi:hypothetical protein
MVNLQFSMPVWGPGHFVDTNSSHVDFELSPPLDTRPDSLDVELALEAADAHLGRGEWMEALDALKEHGQNPLARRMCLKALEELNDPALSIEMLKPPRESAEAVVLGYAILNGGNLAELEEFLNDQFIVKSTDASVNEIVGKLRLRAAR